MALDCLAGSCLNITTITNASYTGDKHACHEKGSSLSHPQVTEVVQLDEVSAVLIARVFRSSKDILFETWICSKHIRPLFFLDLNFQHLFVTQADADADPRRTSGSRVDHAVCCCRASHDRTQVLLGTQSRDFRVTGVPFRSIAIHPNGTAAGVTGGLGHDQPPRDVHDPARWQRWCQNWSLESIRCHESFLPQLPHFTLLFKGLRMFRQNGLART